MAKKNGELKIEKGIPLPKACGVETEITRTLRKLKPGESVLVGMTSSAASVRARYAIGTGKYACRKTEDGVRVWRIK